MLIQLVYNWRHRLVGKSQKIEREVRYLLLTQSNGSLLINPHRCEEDSNIVQLV